METEVLPGDVQRISLDGRLDIEGSQAIDVRFSALTTTRKAHIVVDLAAVSFLASIGIRLLITAARGQKGRGGKLVMASAQPAVKKALVSAGIDQLVPLYDDLEAARAAIVAA
ncbi:MAG: STAS domain-containing protein [Lysobacter sp.]|nr:STAS domain-containing protein [Lysobacter sp.]